MFLVKPRRFLRLPSSTRDGGESRWLERIRIVENSPDFAGEKSVVFGGSISGGVACELVGPFRGADFDCDVERKIWIEGRSSSAQNYWSVAVRDGDCGDDGDFGSHASANGVAGCDEREAGCLG